MSPVPSSARHSASREVDVLVIGAGPGGSAAAYHLARRGVDVLLAEKVTFPREKVCGDGLTPRGVLALGGMGIDPFEPGFERVDGLRIYTRRTTLELPWPKLHDFPDYGLVRTRHDLDELLARRAEKAGALLWEGAEVLEPVLTDGWVTGATVRKDEEEIDVRARYVVAADGAASRIGAGAGVRRVGARPLGIAARRYYRIDRTPGPWLEVWMDLWSGEDLMPGYGWLFPVSDGTINLGAGLLNTFKNFKELSAPRVFEAFAAMLPASWNISEETAEGRALSGPLPMGFNRRPAAVPGMLLVGDAAGIVNPFNGEGIAYAMESAELAAELVSEALLKDRPAVAHLYPTMLAERYGRYYYLGRQFVKAIGHPSVMRAFTDYGVPRERLMRFVFRVLGNLTDGRDGDVQDKLMYALERLAPAS
ncbi:MAG: geranylgeranyl reductase family protein [Actinomycetota bacterium]